MNIYSPHQSRLNESADKQADRLYESYKRTKNKKQFLNENGNTDENVMIHAFIGLNESVKDSSKRFTFENGMYIPSINPKVTGRLSLYNIAESCDTSNEFVNKVSTEICERMLQFEPTLADKKALMESFNAYVSCKMI